MTGMDLEQTNLFLKIFMKFEAYYNISILLHKEYFPIYQLDEYTELCEWLFKNGNNLNINANLFTQMLFLELVESDPKSTTAL